MLDIDSLQSIILFNHILKNNWHQAHNFYYSFGSGITSTIRCNPLTKRRCPTTLDQANPLTTGSDSLHFDSTSPYLFTTLHILRLEHKKKGMKNDENRYELSLRLALRMMRKGWNLHFKLINVYLLKSLLWSKGWQGKGNEKGQNKIFANLKLESC